MLIVNPRASSIAPRQADVIPLPKDETTPPVMKTYEVMREPNKFAQDHCAGIAIGKKQERAGSKALPGKRGAFFQPFEFRAVVGLKTV